MTPSVRLRVTLSTSFPLNCFDAVPAHTTLKGEGLTLEVSSSLRAGGEFSAQLPLAAGWSNNTQLLSFRSHGLLRRCILELSMNLRPRERLLIISAVQARDHIHDGFRQFGYPLSDEGFPAWLRDRRDNTRIICSAMTGVNGEGGGRIQCISSPRRPASLAFIRQGEGVR